MPKIIIPEVLDSLEDEPKIYHSLYVKGDDGKYRYKDPAAAIEGMRRAKEERAAIQEELTELKAKYKDVDPAKYAELVQLEKDFKEVDSTNRAGLEEVKTQLRNQYEGTIREKDKRITEGDQRYANRILSGDLRTTLAAAGATEKGAELLMKTLRGDITVRMDASGEPEFLILDKAGKARLNAHADPYTLGDLVADAKKDFPQLFTSNAGSGGGSGTQDKNTPAPTDERPSSWNFKQKKAYIDQHGHVAFNALLRKEAASKDVRKTA
jgi:hypothetical protein